MARGFAAVTDDHVKDFWRDGAVAIRDVIDASTLAELEKAFADLMRGANDLSNYYDDDPAQKKGHGLSLTRGENWLHSAYVNDFIRSSCLPRIAAKIMESEGVWLFEDLLIYRSEGSDRPTPWHQDSSQNPLAGRQQCSIWLSLEKVTRDTGALRFVAGSHRGPTYVPYVPQSQADRVAQDMQFFDGGPIPDVDRQPDHFIVKSYDLDPGDVLVFHPQSLHGAFGSARSFPRRTLSFRFIGDDVRWQHRAAMFHQWLRDLDLADGDPVRGERFPQLWPEPSRAT